MEKSTGGVLVRQAGGKRFPAAMAGAALDSLLNPAVIQKAKEEFMNLRAGKQYECGIPE